MSDEKSEKANDEAASEESSVRGRSAEFIFTLIKYFIFTFGIYLVYYLQLSFLWLVILVLFLAAKDDQKYKKRRKRALRTAALQISEKDALAQKFEDLPSWVMFPDVDRAEWLNTIVKQLWPTVNNYLIKLLRTTVQKKIRKKFDNFKFEELDFGNICPRIDGVKVYDRNSNSSEIIIDFDVFYDGDCDINFTIFGTKGNVNDVQIGVEMRIVLKPLIRKLPLIGGMQIFFLNTPDIDFNLEGIANIPGLGHFMKKRLAKVLAKKIVFPNNIPLRFSKSVEGQELKHLEPEGVLRVHVAEAKNLEKKDVNVLGIGKSDPYATVSLGTQEFKTKIIDNCTDPKWDFWCEFCILDPAVQHLDIEVLDHDIKSDDFLGSAVVDISRVVNGGKRDQWITLERVKHGKIHLRFSWLTLSNDYNDLEAANVETQLLQVPTLSTALLTVYIELAKDLPQLSAQKKPNPYITLTLGGTTYETKTKKHTVNPVWEQGFFFLTSRPETESLFITVIDKKTQERLDQFAFGIYNLTDKPKMRATKCDYKMSKGGLLSMALNLRILKNDTTIDEDVTDSSEEEEDFIRRGSTKSTNSVKDENIPQGTVEELEPIINKMIARENELVRRSPSVTTSTGKYGLGQIQITLRYSEPRQKLVVVVHKIANLPIKDPSNIPDPYVKLLLIPGGTHKKHKTRVIMDNSNPVFDQTFEYLLSQCDLAAQKLIITVKSKIKLALHNHLMGQVVLHLKDFNLTQPYTSWFDLGPEQKD